MSLNRALELPDLSPYLQATRLSCVPAKLSPGNFFKRSPLPWGKLLEKWNLHWNLPVELQRKLSPTESSPAMGSSRAQGGMGCWAPLPQERSQEPCASSSSRKVTSSTARLGIRRPRGAEAAASHAPGKRGGEGRRCGCGTRGERGERTDLEHPLLPNLISYRQRTSKGGKPLWFPSSSTDVFCLVV